MLERMPNPDNVPGAVSTGYQLQNTNIFAIQTGLDTTEPFDDGYGFINIPVGGIVECNGVMYKIINDIVLTKPDKDKAYWIEITTSDNGSASAGLVTHPGVWNSAKKGNYNIYNNESYRTLNWISLGVIEDSENMIIEKINIERDTLQLPIGWYYFKMLEGESKIMTSNKSDIIKDDEKFIFFNEKSNNINVVMSEIKILMEI